MNRDERDELRRHAVEAAARQVRQEHATDVHRKMQQAAHFLSAFAAQMNVISPRARQIMDLPGVMRFPDLVIRDFFVEERTQVPHDVSATIARVTGERYAYVLLSYHYSGPRVHTTVREIGPEIQRLEALLSQHRVQHEVKLVRNARAQVERAIFTIHSHIAAGIKLIPDYEQGKVRIGLRNIDRLASWDVVVDAQQIQQPLLDELGRCILGHPNDFRRMAFKEAVASKTPAPTSTHSE